MSDRFFATQVTESTCIGVSPLDVDYPLPYGNCFSVRCANFVTIDGKSVEVPSSVCGLSIVNFRLENLNEAVKRGITWPIRVQRIDALRPLGIIHDERIPDDWYAATWCETCCPERLLPLPQRLCHQRQERRGERTVTPHSIGYNFAKTPRLDPVGCIGNNTTPPGLTFIAKERIGAAVGHVAGLERVEFE